VTARRRFGRVSVVCVNPARLLPIALSTDLRAGERRGSAEGLFTEKFHGPPMMGDSFEVSGQMEDELRIILVSDDLGQGSRPHIGSEVGKHDYLLLLQIIG